MDAHTICRMSKLQAEDVLSPVRGRRIPSGLAVHHHPLLVGVQRVDDVVRLLEEDGAKLFTLCKGVRRGGNIER